MDKATLKQANQILNLISQKDSSSQQLQALYASGLFSDLLDANVDQVSREKFREMLGLKPLLPSFTIGVRDTSDIQPPYDDREVLEDAKSPIGTLELKLAELLLELRTVLVELGRLLGHAAESLLHLGHLGAQGGELGVVRLDRPGELLRPLHRIDPERAKAGSRVLLE